MAVKRKEINRQGGIRRCIFPTSVTLKESRVYGTLTASSPVHMYVCPWVHNRARLSLSHLVRLLEYLLPSLSPHRVSSVLHPFVIPFTFIPSAPFEPRQAGRQLVLNYGTSLGAVTRDPERKGGRGRDRGRERGPLKDVSYVRVQPIEHMHFSMRCGQWRVVDVRWPSKVSTGRFFFDFLHRWIVNDESIVPPTSDCYEVSLNKGKCGNPA